MAGYDRLIKELNFKAIRSGGAGGQHVNKVSSKVQLSFDLQNSTLLSGRQKQLIGKSLASKVSSAGILILQCDESRSQHKNKEIVIKRFLKLIEKALRPVKKRKATKPSKSSILKRLESKKKVSKKKSSRKKPDLE